MVLIILFGTRKSTCLYCSIASSQPSYLDLAILFQNLIGLFIGWLLMFYFIAVAISCYSVQKYFVEVLNGVVAAISFLC